MPAFGYILLKCATKPLSWLPLGFHRKLGSFVGRVAGSILRYRRDTVMVNLSRSFPEKKYRELVRICDRFYSHFGKVICETIWFGGASPKRLVRSHIVEIENPDLLNRIYNSGRSLFVLTSHTGNWELFGGYKFYGYKEEIVIPQNDLVAAYRRIKSRAWNDFMLSNRIAPIADKKNFTGLVESFSILRFAVRNRHIPKLYNFITDQYPYSKSSKVDIGEFLHQRTYTMDGGAALAHRLGMSVLYMNMEEKDDGNYRMSFSLIAEDASTMEVNDIMRTYYDMLEADIKAQPWNYLWTHRRWK